MTGSMTAANQSFYNRSNFQRSRYQSYPYQGSSYHCSSYQKHNDSHAGYSTTGSQRSRNRLRSGSGNERSVFMLTFMAVVLITVVLILCSFLTTSKVSASETASDYKYVTSIEIKAGDSIWSIASCYYSAEYTDMNEYIAEIEELNHISKDSPIHAGEYILVPYYADLDESMSD